MSAIQLNEQGWNFSVFGFPDQPVTQQNRETLVTMVVEDVLVEKRKRSLEAFKHGILAAPVLSDIIPHLTWRDLLSLIAGDVVVSAEKLLDAIAFQDFPPQSQTKDFVRQVILSFSAPELSAFLEWATSLRSLPIPCQANFMTIRCLHANGRPSLFPLPSAHTCFNSIDFYDYNDLELVRSKLRTALTESNLDFGLI